MTLELTLIAGFLFHLMGDYIFQNDWMAQNKTKNSTVAAIHATIYSVPFLFLVPFVYDKHFFLQIAWLIIYWSHFFIDRYRLATYWIKLVNWNWNSKNFGYDDNKPQWMSVWLMIIIDNILHLLINSLVIFFYFKVTS